jgi:hypothetical protein
MVKNIYSICWIILIIAVLLLIYLPRIQYQSNINLTLFWKIKSEFLLWNFYYWKGQPTFFQTSNNNKYFIEIKKNYDLENPSKVIGLNERLYRENLQTWKKSIIWNSHGPLCQILYFHKELFCIWNDTDSSAISLSIFNNPSPEIDPKKILLTSQKVFSDISGHTIIGKKMYIVWYDSRLRLPKFYNPRMLNIYYSDREFWPILVMAWELNLDTYEFREHVIRYYPWNEPMCWWEKDTCPPGTRYEPSLWQQIWTNLKGLWGG